jgi:hypothetical protein
MIHSGNAKCPHSYADHPDGRGTAGAGGAAGSRKGEAQMQERARIVLLAAEGTAPLLARELGGIHEQYISILPG